MTIISILLVVITGKHLEKGPAFWAISGRRRPQRERARTLISLDYSKLDHIV